MSSLSYSWDAEEIYSIKEGGTLFLGDLSCFCQDQDIYNFFRVVGEIQSIRLMRSKITNKCLGYGFITFVDLNVLPMALRLNGQLLLGRRVKIGLANPRPRKTTPSSPLSMSRVSHNKNDTNYPIAQLHFSFVTQRVRFPVTEETIYKIFSQFGDIDDVKIKKYSCDAKSQSGYGFVHFSYNEFGLEAAIQASFVISQVMIDDVIYDCCLTRSLEAALQHSPSVKLPLPGIKSKVCFVPKQFKSHAEDRAQDMLFSTYDQRFCGAPSKEVPYSQKFYSSSSRMTSNDTNYTASNICYDGHNSAQHHPFDY